jgi:diguanylate cyclase (GGDEF)-like protein
MPQDQVLQAILGAGVLATLLLVGMVALLARSEGRSAPSGGGDSRMDDDAREAAAIEAFVATVSDDRDVRARHRPLPHAMSSAGWAVTPRAPLAHQPESSPVPPADPGTWARAIREESARVARYGHSVTVVMAEVPHLDVVADRLGRDVADRVVTMTARLLLTESRAVDRVARLGDGRFGVLILDTAEIAAVSYVERVRFATDSWLASAGLSVRLSVGWASPVDGDVTAAAALAQQRMYDANRGPSPRAMPSAHPARSAESLRPRAIES